MPSTYTVNLGIEKPATGEQSGTWGDTTNVNFDILDQAINGAERVTLTSAGSSGSPNTLQISNGATSDGRNKWIEFYSSGDLGGDVFVQLDPNDAEKIVFVRNSLAGSQSVLLFQGTYNSGRDLEIPAGVDMVVKFDGGGASAATVTDVYTKLRATEITTPTLTAGTADINGGTIDNSVIGGSTAAAVTGTTVVANTSLNIAGDGATVTGIKDEDDMSSNSPTKLATQQSIKAYVDSQVGTVDTWAEVLANGATSGSTNPEIDSGQALKTNTINETTAGSGVTIDSVLLKDDVVNATDVETGSISANDGTAAATIANTTGNFTITNFISNSVDIGGGAIDGTVIGGSTAAAGTFTTGQFNTSVNVDGTATMDGLTVDGSTTLNTSSTLFANLNYSGSNLGKLSTDGVNLNVEATSNLFLKVNSATRAKFDGNGDITFYDTDGTTASFVYDASAGLTINEAGADRDFRVESDSATHMLFVDAGANAVGIGTSAPLVPLHLTTSGAGEAVRIQSDDAGGGQGPILGLYRNSSSPVDGDNLGVINFYGEDSAGNITTYAAIDSETYDVSNGTEDGRLTLKTAVAGSLTSRIYMNFNETVVNESGADLDFRVESDSNANMLFVDGGVSAVGIGTATQYDGTALVSPLTISSLSGGSVLEAFRGSASLFTLAMSSTGISSWNTSGSAAAHSFRTGTTVGTASIKMYLGATGDLTTTPEAGGHTTFNEDGIDANFRVETSGNAYMLMVNGGNDTVGIGVNPYTATTDLNLLGDGLSIKNDKNGDNNNWSLIQNTVTGSGSNLKFSLATGNVEFTTGGSIVATTAANYNTVFNEDGNDSDFRVESANNASAFFVDASADQVRTDAVFVHDTDGANQPFYITRTGGLDQALAVTMDDNNVMFTSVQDETSGANFIFYSTNATTTNLPLLQLDYSSGSVFNESGVSYQNVRMESDADTHAFYLNAATGNIGIVAGASPPQPLAIGTSAGSGLNYYSGTTNVISSGSGIKVSKAIPNDASVGSGLNLSNTESTDGTMSPMIHFSALSASTTYSTTYAGIWGRKRSSGTDNNWNTGSIEFGTSHSAGINKRMELNYLGGLITTPLGSGHTVFNEDSADADFRVESDTNAHLLFVDGGSEQVKIGSSDVGTYGKLEVQNADGRHGTGQRSWSLIAGTSHPSKAVDGVMAFNTASAGSQLSIPIVSQGNQHRPCLVELTFLSGEYNTSGDVKAGFVRFAFQSLTSLGSLAVLETQGNVSGVSISGMNILVSFTSAYNAGQSDAEGVMCYYRIMNEQPQYVQMWDATLN